MNSKSESLVISELLLTQFGTQSRKFVNVFTTVMTVRNTEPKVEVKGLEESVAEEVTLNHPKIVYWFIADTKLNAKPMEPMKKMRKEV